MPPSPPVGANGTDRRDSRPSRTRTGFLLTSTEEASRTPPRTPRQQSSRWCILQHSLLEQRFRSAHLALLCPPSTPSQLQQQFLSLPLRLLLHCIAFALVRQASSCPCARLMAALSPVPDRPAVLIGFQTHVCMVRFATKLLALLMTTS